MTSDTRVQHSELERLLLEDLCARYEDHGYRFDYQPKRVPTFFGDYRPDAIASKAGRNVAIEVKRQRDIPSEHSLRQIGKLLDGHPDWELRVVFTGADPLDEIIIAPPDSAQVRNAIDEVRALVAEKRLRPAFMAAWSLLEACKVRLGQEMSNRPSRPEVVIQSLASAGHLDPRLERRLHDLVKLRNRIVHGDLQATPTPGDVALVLEGVDEAMSALAE